MQKFFITLTFFFSQITYAQQLPPIQLDRPDQTECPFIVPKKYIQAEIGITYENSGSNFSSLLMPTALIKYGVTEKLELRLITELQQTKEFSKKYTGITPVVVGFKTKLIEEKGWIPNISFIGHLALAPVASKEFQADYYAPSFRFTLQHTLSPKFSLGYNLGAEWNGTIPETSFLYTITTGYAITEKLGSYIELFGFFPEKNKPDHNIDGGLTYLLNNDFMLDISAGTGLDKYASGYYASLGFSFRFK